MEKCQSKNCTTISPLRKIIQESHLSTDVNSSVVSTNKKLLLPFDLVSEFLNKQEIVKYSGTNVNDIYNGINLFLKKEETEVEYKDSEIKKEETEVEYKDSEIKKEKSFQCKECEMGNFIVDSKEGSMVCNICGLVVREGMNIVPEFIKEPELDYRNKVNKIYGVSQKVIDMVNRSSDDYKKKNKFREDLEHFNGFTNLPLDDLNHFEKLLRNQSKVKSVSYNGKVVGVLLAHILQKKLISEHEIKKSVLTKRKISEVTSPPREFKCNNCGLKCYTVKESKYHCTLLSRYSKKFR